MRTNKRTYPAVEIVPEAVPVLLDLDRIFGRAAPVELDLGCGDGTMLAALAEQSPHRNFLGVEFAPSRIRGACRKIGDAQLGNARVLRGEIMLALKRMLPASSVEVCYLFFPDPWPKRRHHNRRVMTEEFLKAVAAVLVPHGSLRIATDHAEYFAHMQRVVLQTPLFDVASSGEMEPAVVSTFENRFRAHGAQIHRLVLRRKEPIADAGAGRRLVDQIRNLQ